MRNLVRLVLLVAVCTALVVTAVVTVPVVLRDLYRNGTSTVAKVLTPLSSTFSEGSTVYASDDRTVLGTLEASKTQLPVKLDQIAPILRKAVLDTEDERFYQHGGIDLPSTIRALLSDSAGNDIQGGSTITQQLVKQVYLNSERKLSRKIREAVIADRLEKLYTKNEILDAYLNTVYFGSGAYGVEAAAKAYWRETAAQLTVPQSAMLAGLIQAPSDYDPVTNPALARQRRTVVLGRMLHYGTIDKKQYATANATALPTIATIERPKTLSGIDGYYVAQVKAQLLGAGSPLGSTLAERRQALFEGGLKIYTNLNPAAQAQAEAAVLAKTPVPPENDQDLQEALVSITPANGNVNAMIAGQNYATTDNGFDVVTEGGVQPGSGFKIFTLLAALQDGDSIEDPVDGTQPCAIGFPDNPSYLQNPAHNDEGDVGIHETTILNATAQSLNCAYLRIGHQVGLPAVIAEAEKLGIPASTFAHNSEDPSIIIGTVSVDPLEMAAAYATLASGGVYHTPQFLNHVVDRTGTTIYRESTKGKVVLPPGIVTEADVAFQAVVQSGTGYPEAVIPGREVAGKTGTTSGPTAAWFNGYTPQLETTVWMGNLKGDVPSMVVGGAEVYGASFPAPTVQAYMAAALAGQPDENFPALDYADLPHVVPVPEASAPTPYDTVPTNPTTYYPYTTEPTSTSTTNGPAVTTPTTGTATTPATTRTSTSTPSSAPSGT